MSAPSLKNILQYELAVQTAWSAILQNAGIPAGQIFLEFLNQSAITPRVEINLTNIVPTLHRGAFLPGQFTFDAWHGQLITRVITRRNVHGAQHDDFLGIARGEALYFKARFTTTLLPWHSMTQIEEESTHRMIDPERDEDITELTHKIILAVRAGAWPATEP
jgi:hypothetical protein